MGARGAAPHLVLERSVALHEGGALLGNLRELSSSALLRLEKLRVSLVGRVALFACARAKQAATVSRPRASFERRAAFGGNREAQVFVRSSPEARGRAGRQQSTDANTDVRASLALAGLLGGSRAEPVSWAFSSSPTAISVICCASIFVRVAARRPRWSSTAFMAALLNCLLRSVLFSWSLAQSSWPASSAALLSADSLLSC